MKWAPVLLSFLFFSPSCGQPGQPDHRPDAARPVVQFTDIAPSAGITFRHTNGKSGRYYFLETVASGGGFIDYDGDGDLDVYLLNGAAIPGFVPNQPLSSILYRNDGDGSFTDVTVQAGVDNAGGYGMGLAVADYDNDGDDDLFVTNYGANILYRNQGDGTFRDVTARANLMVPANPTFSTSAAFLDYDRDGHLDLYVCAYVEFDFEANRRCSRDGIQSYCGPDIYEGAADLLYRNNGDGSFSDVSAEAGIANPDGKGLGVVGGDYDGDGWTDIFVANDLTPDFLYRNNGDGTFTDMALLAGVAYGEDGVARAGMGVDMGDYDRNGSPDIYVTNFSLEPNSLHRNNGNGTFTETTFAAGVGNPTLLFLGFGTAFKDFDHDGWLDLFAANGHVIDNISLFDPTITYAQTNQLFRNEGDGVFTDVSPEAGPPFQVERVHRGAAFGDVDNDGDVDVLVTTVNDIPLLLRNDGTGGHSALSLLVATEGVRSNRNGIGARVTVVTDAVRQSREIRSAYSYLAANDLRVHFGLGAYAGADSVIVDWPGGARDVATGVEGGQLITIREGAGIVLRTPFLRR
ncbi:MAG: CRTAC1 family protein [Gemmatimonadota bacterium]|nr:CRTAC1 family protein [Gemmatimonadota bacterium]